MPKTLRERKQDYCRDVCHAWCCKNLVMFTQSTDKDLDKFFKLRGIDHNPETKEIIVPCKCGWLNNHNKCRLYSWRPYSCRVYECTKLKNLADVHIG